MGRVQPFSLAIINDKGSAVAQYSARPQLVRTNTKRERILREIKQVRNKIIKYDHLAIPIDTLSTEVARMRNKVSRMGDSIKNEVAADIVNKATRHKVSLIHIEDLKWAVGKKYGSKWNHTGRPRRRSSTQPLVRACA